MKYYTLKEVAALVGVSVWRLYHNHYSGKLPEPTKYGRTRLYTTKDVDKIKDHFSNQKEAHVR
jgi:DNA-binding transcriptional MerR regulator